ncbi:hypothetical protein ANN_03190 [Periplaneta americana]|uniref:Zinc finger PHD-type domain-containing protein n=1 Tax=Periplaneta americana TaxID=6978 RepID=A0ABQ8TYH1_PERAM|nr:hypothetical protein ANN_03190 [Periplaneta americana]
MDEVVFTKPHVEESQSSVSTPCNDSASIAPLLKKLSPIPDASKRRLATRKRKAEKSQILTGTPYKESLDEKQVQKNKKDEKKRRKFAKTLNLDQSSTSVQASVSSVTCCILCGESFEEDWIQCEKCKGWAHEKCADLENATFYYECDKCMQVQ